MGKKEASQTSVCLATGAQSGGRDAGVYHGEQARGPAMLTVPQGRPGSARKFLRILGILWVAAVCLTLAGALLAPHLGRILDFALHQTVYRRWTALRLFPTQPFFDLSTPQHTIKSYYSALYRGDTARMDQLTAGAFRAAMRQRLAHGRAGQAPDTYRSYLYSVRQSSTHAEVLEKFHLFWSRGLRFSLRRQDTTWQVTAVELYQKPP